MRTDRTSQIAADLDDALPPVRLDLKGPLVRPSEGPTDAEVTANSEALGRNHGAFTSMPEQPAQTFKMSLLVPDYLNAELTHKAGDLAVTKQHLILEALRAAGYTVRPIDNMPDARRAKRIRVL